MPDREQPVEAEFAEALQKIGQAINLTFNEPGKEKRVGFVVLLFPFGDDEGRVNYISNADRDDIARMMEAKAAQFRAEESRRIVEERIRRKP